MAARCAATGGSRGPAPVTPIGFGPPARRLFGLFDSAQAERPSRSAVLICPPFGHEAIRSHRLMRVLTGRLSRERHDVLRFDYFGTGDSMGDDDDADLDGWVGDLLQAHAELLRRSPGARVTWIGSRLGASLAYMAARGAQPLPQRLVLWDPIVDGADYVSVLRLKHVESLELRYFIPDRAWRKRLATDAQAFADEAIGFSIPAILRQQMATLQLAAMPPPAGVQIDIVAATADAAARRWSNRLLDVGGQARYVALDHQLVWTSDPEPFSAMVPQEVVRSLLQQVND